MFVPEILAAFNRPSIAETLAVNVVRSEEVARGAIAAARSIAAVAAASARSDATLAAASARRG